MYEEERTDRGRGRERKISGANSLKQNLILEDGKASSEMKFMLIVSFSCSLLFQHLVGSSVGLRELSVYVFYHSAIYSRLTQMEQNPSRESNGN